PGACPRLSLLSGAFMVGPPYQPYKNPPHRTLLESFRKRSQILELGVADARAKYDSSQADLTTIGLNYESHASGEHDDRDIDRRRAETRARNSDGTVILSYSRS